MKWDQKLIRLEDPTPREINDLLTDLGADEWELVSHTAPTQEYSRQWSFAFKRPIA